MRRDARLDASAPASGSSTTARPSSCSSTARARSPAYAATAGSQDAAYRVRAGAVVLATGGCAFLSKALGCDVATGDGALYGGRGGRGDFRAWSSPTRTPSPPAFTSVTKTAFYGFATFFHADGIAPRGRRQPGRPLGDRQDCCSPGSGALPDRPGRRRSSRPADALGAAELLPDLRPARDRPVHRQVPGHAAGSRARCAAPAGSDLVGDDCATVRPRPVRRRRRRHPRADLRRVHRRRQPQLGVGDVVGHLGRSAARPGSPLALGPPRPRAAPGRGTGAAGLRPAGVGHRRRPPCGGGARPCCAEVHPYDKNYLRTATGSAPRSPSSTGSGPTARRASRGVRATTRCGPRQAAAMVGARPVDVHERPGPDRERGAWPARQDFPELDPAAAPPAHRGRPRRDLGLDRSPRRRRPERRWRRDRGRLRRAGASTCDVLRRGVPDQRLRPRSRRHARSSPGSPTARPASCARRTARPTRCSSPPPTDARRRPARRCATRPTWSPPACSAATAEIGWGRGRTPGAAEDTSHLVLRRPLAPR